MYHEIEGDRPPIHCESTPFLPQTTPCIGLDPAEVSASRAAMWAAGLRPIALWNHDARVPKPGKQPIGKDWIGRARQTPPAAITEPVDPRALNTGALCGALRLLDVDIEDPAMAARARVLAEETLGKAPVRSRANTARLALAYRAAVGEPNKRRIEAPQPPDGTAGPPDAIEVLGHGQQVVIAGIHPSGVPVEWDRQPAADWTLADLTEVTEDRIGAYLAACAKQFGWPGETAEPSPISPPPPPPASATRVIRTDPEADIEDVASALAVIPSAGSDEQRWYQIGAAVYAATDGSPDGLAAWCEWSQPGKDGDSGCAGRWDAWHSMPPNRVGFGTLFHEAVSTDPSWTRPSRLRPPDPAPSDAGGGGSDKAGFVMSASGLFRIIPAEADKPTVRLWVCAPFDTTGRCHAAGSDWATIMTWTDPAGQPHTQLVGRAMLHKEPKEIAAALDGAGLRCNVARPAQAALRDYLAGLQPARIVRVVDRAGWHDTADSRVYIMPDGEAHGRADHDLMLKPDIIVHDASTASSGTLAEWNDAIGRLAIGNDRLMLALNMAFAGPLLHLTDDESGGIHLVGASRLGKSTALYAAASVWGKGDRSGCVRSWRATSNGLEGVAAATSDGLLPMDEMGQADGREVADVVYMLANETGKSRADRSGGARTRKTWRTLFLSTGELSLEAKMAEAGRQMHAGLEVRLINLAADAGAGMGLFQNLHGFRSPAELAEHVRQAASRVYGTAIRAFLARLATDQQAGRDAIDLQAGFLADHLPTPCNGQVRTVCRRFGLIAAAGELAAAWGVVDWPEGEATRAAAACFDVWHKTRGDDGAAEDTIAIRQVRAFIEAHGSSRFEEIGCDRLAVRDRVGWREVAEDGTTTAYFVGSQAWRAIICKGLDSDRVARVFAERGWLTRDGKHLAVKRRITGAGRPRVYELTGTILDTD